MNRNDTVSLLKECDAGAKMAVATMNEVIHRVQDSSLKQLLTESRSRHEELGNEIHRQLLAHNSCGQEQPLIAKGMSWLKTNAKLTMNNSDAAIADLVTDGCNMGVKSLRKYSNQYSGADPAAQKLCEKLADAGESLCEELGAYLGGH